jgi:hypothetical protein
MDEAEPSTDEDRDHGEIPLSSWYGMFTVNPPCILLNMLGPQPGRVGKSASWGDKYRLELPIKLAHWHFEAIIRHYLRAGGWLF